MIAGLAALNAAVCGTLPVDETLARGVAGESSPAISRAVAAAETGAGPSVG